MLKQVTFGITTFERPGHLDRLVSSILLRYPSARIVVADNGKTANALPAQVKRLRLPFDCGLSAARNALIDQLETEYLLILEDDFYFTHDSHIEDMVEVLKSDPEVGVVGGSIRGRLGRVSAYSMDFEVFRKTLFVRETSHRQKVSPNGVPYQLCDMVWNFALFRKEMLTEHRWDDRLKVGEHTPYFWEVKKAGNWRVACCPSTVCYHVPDHRTEDYLGYRQRARQFFRSFLKREGFTDYKRLPPRRYVDPLHDRPNIVVLGVGHSGTSILTQMLHTLGWQPGDADEQFAESIRVRALNHHIQKRGHLPPRYARKLLKTLPEAWAIKDPRFVMTLRHWLPFFAEMDRPPQLVRIQRDMDAVAESYRRRKNRGDVMHMLRDRERMCQEEYARWPWGKMTIQYENLAQSVSLFTPGETNSDQQPRQQPRRQDKLTALRLDGPGSFDGSGNDDGEELKLMGQFDGSGGAFSLMSQFEGSGESGEGFSPMSQIESSGGSGDTFSLMSQIEGSGDAVSMGLNAPTDGSANGTDENLSSLFKGGNGPKNVLDQFFAGLIDQNQAESEADLPSLVSGTVSGPVQSSEADTSTGLEDDSRE